MTKSMLALIVSGSFLLTAVAPTAFAVDMGAGAEAAKGAATQGAAKEAATDAVKDKVKAKVKEKAEDAATEKMQDMTTGGAKAPE